MLLIAHRHNNIVKKTCIYICMFNSYQNNNKHFLIQYNYIIRYYDVFFVTHIVKYLTISVFFSYWKINNPCNMHNKKIR